MSSLVKFFILRLWEDACESSDTESHAGFIDGAKSIKDRHGNMLKLIPRERDMVSPQIIAFKNIHNLPFTPFNISRDEFDRCLEQWEKGYKQGFRTWDNKNTGQ